MGRLFGTNGVRGIFGKDLSLDFISDLTKSLGVYFGKGPVLIGYDGRNSSEIIAKVVSASLNNIGIDCDNAGLVPTPCLEFATKKLGYAGGLMITASHNPPEYNGIKPVARDGVEISREDELIVEDIFFNKKWKTSVSRFGNTTKQENAINEYINGILFHVDIPKIKSRHFRIVLDLGNGAQAVAAPLLCQELGCEIIKINEKIDGNFSGRGSEPTPENLSELSAVIKKSGADLGIAFDGDGDRSLFCDENGEILTGDKSALLLCKYLFEKNPSSTIVTCLNSGSAIEKISSTNISKVIRTKVGSVEVSRMMVKTKALAGFEENGGFMYGKHNQVRDGCMTLALMMNCLSSQNKKLSEMIIDLPPSFTSKDKVSCPKEKIEFLLNTLKTMYPNSDTTDGIKIELSEKSWVMIRASGTEPIVRIYAESYSRESLNGILAEFLEKVKSIISR